MIKKNLSEVLVLYTLPNIINDPDICMDTQQLQVENNFIMICCLKLCNKTMSLKIIPCLVVTYCIILVCFNIHIYKI